jgi:DNA-binding beta-propeller fold protein YncE
MHKLLLGAVIFATLHAQAFGPQGDGDQPTAQVIPNTGQLITPTAPRGARFEPLNPGLAAYPQYVAGQAVTTIVSPDRSTLLILTSGYNLLNYTSGTKVGQTNPAGSSEYVFVFDISNKIPVKKQVLQVPNTYNGIVFDPSGESFYVAGGVDDNLHIYDLASGVWGERQGSPIRLEHNNTGVGLAVQPAAAGVAISANGQTLVVTNYFNDSISILTKTDGKLGKDRRTRSAPRQDRSCQCFGRRRGGISVLGGD